jgi:PAS domain S-box-containing protein
VAERFRSLFQQLPEALLILSADGVIRDANQAAADLYRAENAEIVGRDLAELTDAIGAGQLGSRLEDVAEGGGLNLTGTGRRPDGTTFPQELVIARDSEKTDAGIFVLLRDLTESKRLEAGLAALADLSRLQTGHGSVPAVAARALKLSLQLLDADRGALCAFEGDNTVEWLANHRLERLIAASSDLRPSQIPWLARALGTGQPELIDRRRSDHERTALSDAADQLGIGAFAIVPLHSGQELTGVLGIVWTGDPPELAADRQLLTAIGRMVGPALGNIRLRDSLLARQQALDESEARYRTLFQQAPEPILICDWDGRLTDANRAAATLYGRRRRELVARSLTDVAELDRAQRARLMGQLRRGRGATLRVTGRRADGSTFPQLLDVAAITIGGEEKLLVQVRDLTEQERMQAELLQAQKMEALGQLISGVAHELNNPLGAITAFSQLLRTDERLPPDMARDAELLLQEADRTRRIVQNLLDFARQRQPERQPTNLATLVEKTLALHSYALHAAHIRDVVQLPPDLPPVDVDPGQIQQVLLNLTLNAIQSIRTADESGTITIGAEAARNEKGAEVVRLTIADDGPGVDADVRRRLFEPFFTTKAVGEGSGLGLSVSYGIVASHGGRLWFEQADGRGAKFLLELPVSARLPRPSLVPSPARAAGVEVAAHDSRAGHVLAVDDEAAIRAMLERALTRIGHRVTVATSGGEALALLAQQEFDLLLIDHRLAGMDGVDFYAQAIELRPELRGRAVIMSGDTLNPALRRFASANELRLLAKPFDVGSLHVVVEEELSRLPARAAIRPAQARG